LLLIILGVILKAITYKNQSVFEFTPSFLISISILALVMITFDGSSRLKLKEVDAFSNDALKLVMMFIITSIIFVGFFTNLLFYETFSFETIILSIIFAVVVIGTDPSAVFSMLKSKTNKVVEFLQIEAIINTPIVVLIPFILLDFIAEAKTSSIIEGIVEQIVPFFRQIVVGIGAGVIIGIIVFKAMKKVYSHQLSPLGVITAAILSYILAENLGGNGVLSVATMGLFFGSIYVKRKSHLQEFSSMLSNALEIFVFVLTGFLISFKLNPGFIFKSLILFAVLVLARKLSLYLTLRKKGYNSKEQTFMALNMPKGLPVAVVAFSLSVKNISQLGIILDLLLAFIVYSLILSTIIDRYSKKFIKIELEN